MDTTLDNSLQPSGDVASRRSVPSEASNATNLSRLSKLSSYLRQIPPVTGSDEVDHTPPRSALHHDHVASEPAESLLEARHTPPPTLSLDHSRGLMTSSKTPNRVAAIRTPRSRRLGDADDAYAARHGGSPLTPPPNTRPDYLSSPDTARTVTNRSPSVIVSRKGAASAGRAHGGRVRVARPSRSRMREVAGWSALEAAAAAAAVAVAGLRRRRDAHSGGSDVSGRESRGSSVASEDLEGRSWRVDGRGLKSRSLLLGEELERANARSREGARWRRGGQRGVADGMSDADSSSTDCPENERDRGRGRSRVRYSSSESASGESSADGVWSRKQSSPVGSQRRTYRGGTLRGDRLPDSHFRRHDRYDNQRKQERHQHTHTVSTGLHTEDHSVPTIAQRVLGDSTSSGSSSSSSGSRWGDTSRPHSTRHQRQPQRDVLRVGDSSRGPLGDPQPDRVRRFSAASSPPPSDGMGWNDGRDGQRGHDARWGARAGDSTATRRVAEVAPPRSQPFTVYTKYPRADRGAQREGERRRRGGHMRGTRGTIATAVLAAMGPKPLPTRERVALAAAREVAVSLTGSPQHAVAHALAAARRATAAVTQDARDLSPAWGHRRRPAVAFARSVRSPSTPRVWSSTRLAAADAPCGAADAQLRAAAEAAEDAAARGVESPPHLSGRMRTAAVAAARSPALALAVSAARVAVGSPRRQAITPVEDNTVSLRNTNRASSNHGTATSAAQQIVQLAATPLRARRRRFSASDAPLLLSSEAPLMMSRVPHSNTKRSHESMRSGSTRWHDGDLRSDADGSDTPHDHDQPSFREEAEQEGGHVKALQAHKVRRGSLVSARWAPTGAAGAPTPQRALTSPTLSLSPQLPHRPRRSLSLKGLSSPTSRTGSSGASFPRRAALPRAVSGRSRALSSPSLIQAHPWSPGGAAKGVRGVSHHLRPAVAAAAWAASIQQRAKGVPLRESSRGGDGGRRFERQSGDAMSDDEGSDGDGRDDANSPAADSLPASASGQHARVSGDGRDRQRDADDDEWDAVSPSASSKRAVQGVAPLRNRSRHAGTRDASLRGGRAARSAAADDGDDEWYASSSSSSDSQHVVRAVNDEEDYVHRKHPRHSASLPRSPTSPTAASRVAYRRVASPTTASNGLPLHRTASPLSLHRTASPLRERQSPAAPAGGKVSTRCPRPLRPLPAGVLPTRRSASSNPLTAQQQQQQQQLMLSSPSLSSPSQVPSRGAYAKAAGLAYGAPVAPASHGVSLQSASEARGGRVRGERGRGARRAVRADDDFNMTDRAALSVPRTPPLREFNYYEPSSPPSASLSPYSALHSLDASTDEDDMSPTHHTVSGGSTAHSLRGALETPSTARPALPLNSTLTTPTPSTGTRRRSRSAADLSTRKVRISDHVDVGLYTPGAAGVMVLASSEVKPLSSSSMRSPGSRARSRSSPPAFHQPSPTALRGAHQSDSNAPRAWFDDNDAAPEAVRTPAVVSGVALSSHSGGGDAPSESTVSPSSFSGASPFHLDATDALPDGHTPSHSETMTPPATTTSDMVRSKQSPFNRQRTPRDINTLSESSRPSRMHPHHGEDSVPEDRDALARTVAAALADADAPPAALAALAALIHPPRTPRGRSSAAKSPRGGASPCSSSRQPSSKHAARRTAGSAGAVGRPRSREGGPDAHTPTPRSRPLSAAGWYFDGGSVSPVSPLRSERSTPPATALSQRSVRTVPDPTIPQLHHAGAASAAALPDLTAASPGPPAPLSSPRRTSFSQWSSPSPPPPLFSSQGSPADGAVVQSTPAAHEADRTATASIPSAHRMPTDRPPRAAAGVSGAGTLGTSGVAGVAGADAAPLFEAGTADSVTVAAMNTAPTTSAAAFGESEHAAQPIGTLPPKSTVRDSKQAPPPSKGVGIADVALELSPSGWFAS